MRIKQGGEAVLDDDASLGERQEGKDDQSGLIIRRHASLNVFLISEQRQLRRRKRRGVERHVREATPKYRSDRGKNGMDGEEWGGKNGKNGREV